MRRIERGTMSSMVTAQQNVMPAFQTVGIRVVTGRTLTRQDLASGDEALAVVNRAFEEAWCSSLTGRRVHLGDRDMQVRASWKMSATISTAS